MLMTVAICTWNRARLLRQTLEQMTKLTVPSGIEWELLVVDNNCTDNTPEVVAEFAGRLPLRFFHEPKAGTSNARNLVLCEARGTYLIWTDDDVLVDEDWLGAYARAFFRHPEGAVFGGPIMPWFDGSAPAWLQAVLPYVQDAFAVRDFGKDELRLEVPDRLPFGANMAFRLEEARVHRYDPVLGPRPNSELRGEETAVIVGVLAGGVEGWWVPDARVRHFIPKHRQTLGYLRGFFGGYGQFMALTQPDMKSPRLWGCPRWVWRARLRAELSYRFRRAIANPPEQWVPEFKTACRLRGLMAAYRASRV